MNNSNYTFGPDFHPIPMGPEIQVMEPVACTFPELVDSSPRNLIICLIYFIGTGVAAAAGIYLYLKEKGKNGHKNNT